MKAQKLLIYMISVLIIVSIISGTIPGKKPEKPQKIKKVERLLLIEKDPLTWEPVKPGSWGRLKYNPSGTELNYIFIGHNLQPQTDYSLIYYPDPWPGYNLRILGEGTSDSFGDFHLKETVNIGDLPRSYDNNYPIGAKIWLVLSNDIDKQMNCMVGWHPSEYLFEYQLITFDDTDFYQR
jgi:hypothetical protein